MKPGLILATTWGMSGHCYETGRKHLALDKRLQLNPRWRPRYRLSSNANRKRRLTMVSCDTAGFCTIQSLKDDDGSSAKK